MYAMERQELIERLLLDEGRVSVIELARRFEVTTETVRRDLDHLERIGALRRVHGGAVPRDRDSLVEPTLAERSQRRSEAKAAIARRALEVVGDGSAARSTSTPAPPRRRSPHSSPTAWSSPAGRPRSSRTR